MASNSSSCIDNDLLISVVAAAAKYAIFARESFRCGIVQCVVTPDKHRQVGKQKRLRFVYLSKRSPPINFHSHFLSVFSPIINILSCHTRGGFERRKKRRRSDAIRRPSVRRTCVFIICYWWCLWTGKDLAISWQKVERFCGELWSYSIRLFENLFKLN